MKSRKNSKLSVEDGPPGFIDGNNEENADVCLDLNIEGHKISCFKVIGSKLRAASPARPSRALINTCAEPSFQRLRSSLEYSFEDALKVKQIRPLRPKREETKNIRDSSSEKFEPKFEKRKNREMGKAQRRAEKDVTELPPVIHVTKPAFLKRKTCEKKMPKVPVPKVSKIDEEILQNLGLPMKGILPSIVPRNTN